MCIFLGTLPSDIGGTVELRCSMKQCPIKLCNTAFPIGCGGDLGTLQGLVWNSGSG